MKVRYIIAVDYDGTLRTNGFPNLGNIKKVHAVIAQYIRDAHKLGATICLWTCRLNDPERAHLDEAVADCKARDIQLDYINHSPNAVGYEKCNPRKIYADEYIDDRANGGLDVFLDPQFVIDRLNHIKEALSVNRVKI